MKKLFTAWLLCLATVPLSAAEPAEPADLMVDGAYIRALPPTVESTAAYLTVHNHGSESTVLTGARTDVADEVEMHETMNHNGQLHMEQRKTVEVPAQGFLAFTDGGLHFMVNGLHKPLVPGDEVNLVLEFDDGTELPVTVPVRSPMAGGAMEHDH